MLKESIEHLKSFIRFFILHCEYLFPLGEYGETNKEAHHSFVFSISKMAFFCLFV